MLKALNFNLFFKTELGFYRVLSFGLCLLCSIMSSSAKACLLYETLDSCLEFQSGPPQYRSKTIFEDATPEIVRDLFWDDEFRLSNKWDDMLIYHSTLEECPTTGTMVVHWVRKVGFF